jgi:hypothetical protein
MWLSASTARTILQSPLHLFEADQTLVNLQQCLSLNVCDGWKAAFPVPSSQSGKADISNGCNWSEAEWPLSRSSFSDAALP